MNIIKLCLDISATNAYLYGGYLFMFLEDGCVTYINILKLLSLAADGDEELFSKLQLSFLPYQYLKGDTYSFLNKFETIHNSIYTTFHSLFDERSIIPIDHLTLMENMHVYGEVEELPLDVKLYCGEMFVASDAGVYRSDLQADSKYHINPSHLERVFDCPSIALSAGAGTIAVSADHEGLFAYNIFDGNYVDDKADYTEPSIRSEWSKSFSLINYSSNIDFDLLSNTVEDFIEKKAIVDRVSPRFREDPVPRKCIVSMADKVEPMNDLIGKTKIDKDDLSYTFNSKSSGFFIFKDGRLEVRNLRSDDDENYFSSKAVFKTESKDYLFRQKPISASPIEGGCVIELYDKIILINNHQLMEIGSEPCFSVRSYTTSNNYRNLLTIVYQDRIEIISVDSLPKASDRKDRTFRAYTRPQRQEPKPETSLFDSPDDEDLPF